MSGIRKVCAFGLLTMLAVGCNGGGPNANWQPILERTASRSVRLEVERAATDIEAALQTADSCSEDAKLFLRAADRSLRHLLDFYIPLMEAREYSVNAALFFNLHQIDRAVEELNRAEARLQAIAESDQGKLFREMEPPLEILEDARIAIHADPLEAPELLHNLVTRINNMVEKGGLIVN